MRTTIPPKIAARITPIFDDSELMAEDPSVDKGNVSNFHKSLRSPGCFGSVHDCVVSLSTTHHQPNC
jgi:hypothetical protein